MLVMIKETVETPIGTYMRKLYKEKQKTFEKANTMFPIGKIFLNGYEKAIKDMLEAIERS